MNKIEYPSLSKYKRDLSPLFENSTEPKPLLTAVEVGKILNVSPKTVYAWAKTLVLPHVVMGRLIRFKIEDVMEFIARQRSP